MSGFHEMAKRGAVAAAVALTAAAAQAQDAVALRDVAVVDTRSGEIAAHRTVLVRDGKIEDVVDAAAEVGADYTVIEGAGRYVVPGYMDMHAHVIEEAPGGDHDHSAGDRMGQQVKLDLLLANGVTGFRQMSGSAAAIQAARKLNDAEAAGEVVAPEVLQVPGEIYLGQAPTPEAARAFVQAQKASGADFFKIVGGPRDGVLAALEEAESLGLDAAGHLPNSITTAEALAAGFDAFEHLGATPGIALDCAKAGVMIREKMNAAAPKGPMKLPPTFLLNPMLYTGNMVAPALGGILGTFDPAMCGALAQSFVENDVWQVPTLIRLRTMSYGGAPEYRGDENLRYLHPETRALWEKMGAQFEAEIAPEAKGAIEGMYGLNVKITGLLHDAGVKMLAGSDLGGIWLLPGTSLHQEFIELEKAGLSPLEILQATTLNAGEFLDRADELGVVAPGFRADLVLLDADPLASAANLATVSGVMARGSYLDAEELEAMKTAVAEGQGG